MAFTRGVWAVNVTIGTCSGGTVGICRLSAILAGMGIFSAACARGPDGVSRVQATSKDGKTVDLMVRGEKADRTLQKTPTSVTIVTGRSIDEQNLTTVYDALDRVPNVSVEGNRTTFSIRGIDAFNVTGAGDGALANVYVDGAALPRLAMASGPLDLYDTAQIEVLRGPQSTLQGRNALAGAVVVSTEDPTFDWAGKARLLATDRDQQGRIAAAVDGPIINDLLAFRLVSEVSRADGLIENITTQAPADRQGSETFRGKLLLMPGRLPGLRITGSLLYDRHKRGTFYQELDPPYRPRQRITTADMEDSKQTKSLIGTLMLSYEMAPGAMLQSVSNVSRIRYRSLSDANRVALPGQTSQIDDLDKSVQQEVRAIFRTDGLDVLVGAYYLHRQHAYAYSGTQSLSLTSLGVDRQLQAIGLPSAMVDEVLDLYDGALPLRIDMSRPEIIDNYAGFADGAVAVAKGLSLRLGLRYDAEVQKHRATQNVAIDRPLPDPLQLSRPALGPFVGQLNALLLSVAQGANSAEPPRLARFHAWLPKFGLSYDLIPNVVLSATIQRGYRTGGTGFNEQRGSAYDFAPEYTTNYEWAVRSLWFHRRLAINANIYRMDWKDQQVLMQLTPGAIYDTQVVNVGRSRLHGAELEARGIVTGTLSINAGLGFSSARFRNFSVNDGTLAQSAQGKEFPRAPRWTLVGGATFSHPAGWFANANIRYRGSYYQDIVNQDMRDIPSRTFLNAKLGWQGRHVGAYLIATNIFNVQKPDQFFRDIDGRRRGTLNAPRILGLSLESRM